MKFALIPARGGSKRIPNKNIRLFNGKPIIAYSIENALNSDLFDEVIVSTDSEEIADIARSFGASVPFVRPEPISNDYATTNEVIQHAIQFMQARYTSLTHCCCIYATAPLMQLQYLQEAWQALSAAPAKSFAFSVTEFRFPVQRALAIKEGNIAPLYPEYSAARSQDLCPAFHDAGQFYWGTTEGFMSGKAMFSEHAIPIFLPNYLVQDIDTLDDWQRAELIHKSFLQNN